MKNSPTPAILNFLKTLCTFILQPALIKSKRETEAERETGEESLQAIGASRRLK